jgi:3-phosphoshikimate 1-carboxyvinyltransferase
MNKSMPQPLISSKALKPLSGPVRIPGDKSISHRALMFGLLAEGETIIRGMLEGEDVLNTAAACAALGGRVSGGQDGLWRIHGAGLGNLKEPSKVIDMGNSGTSTRLLAGLIAGHPIAVTMTGDASLVKRPMKRIIEPLTRMGAQFITRDGGRLPMALRGADQAKAIEYKLPIASAQVKSAVMLAGLNASGVTTVIEDHPTRDHSENMLRHFGATVTVEDLAEGAQAVHVAGGQTLHGCAVDVPGDPSSGAFPAIAACLIEGSTIRMNGVGVNPRRIGIYTTLQEMGADLSFVNRRIEAGEPVADILVRGIGPLKGIDVPEARVPSMIDEFPALAMVASCASGITHMRGLAELRVKESDRLKMIADGLSACGVKLEMGEDSLTIHGTGKAPRGGATVETGLDHRIAMSFLMLGLVTDEPVCIDDGSPIRTSFPKFIDLMNGLGARIEETELAFDE